MLGILVATWTMGCADRRPTESTPATFPVPSAAPPVSLPPLPPPEGRYRVVLVSGPSNVDVKPPAIPGGLAQTTAPFVFDVEVGQPLPENGVVSVYFGRAQGMSNIHAFTGAALSSLKPGTVLRVTAETHTVRDHVSVTTTNMFAAIGYNDGTIHGKTVYGTDLPLTVAWTAVPR